MPTFKGSVENIENNKNRSQVINAASTHTQYPTSKAVFDYMKKDNTYNPDSDNAQSGKAVAQAISHFDTVLKEGNTFIFDGGTPGEAFDISLVTDSFVDLQSENPIQSKAVAEELQNFGAALAETDGQVVLLMEQIDKLNEILDDRDKVIGELSKGVEERLWHKNIPLTHNRTMPEPQDVIDVWEQLPDGQAWSVTIHGVDCPNIVSNSYEAAAFGYKVYDGFGYFIYMCRWYNEFRACRVSNNKIAVDTYASIWNEVKDLKSRVAALEAK